MLGSLAVLHRPFKGQICRLPESISDPRLRPTTSLQSHLLGTGLRDSCRRLEEVNKPASRGRACAKAQSGGAYCGVPAPIAVLACLGWVTLNMPHICHRNQPGAKRL